MNDSDRLHYLAGQISALTAFAAALIKTHPWSDGLCAAFQESEERTIAVAAPTKARDAYLDGLQDTAKSLRDLLQAKAP
jgi:hypothetical protein